MVVNLDSDMLFKLLYYSVFVVYLLYFVYTFHRYWLTVARERGVDRFQVIGDVYRFIFFSGRSSCKASKPVRAMELQLRVMQLILLVLLIGFVAIPLADVQTPVTRIHGNWGI